MIRRLAFQSRTEWWRGLPGFNTAAILSQRLIHFNGYEKIGLFLVIQVPLAFLPSRPIPTTSVSENDGAERTARQPIKAVKTNELALCGPFEYLRILLVIAGVCVPLIYMDYASNSGVGSWVARTGYVILSFFWLTFAHGRLKDAGWAHNAYPAQYFLIVSVASLMPLAAHWVSGYGALAIFVILQIPTAFLESVPLLEEES
jgi:hypothetical protein